MNRLYCYLLSIVYFINAETINQVGDNLGKQMQSITELLYLVSFVAGLGFLLVTFFKLKQHKDNPAQNPIGNTIMYFVIATLLLYLGNFEQVIKDSLGIASSNVA